MAVGRSVFVLLVLTVYGTVISQPSIKNIPGYDITETEIRLSSIEEIIERSNIKIMDKLESEMRKGFQYLRQELELERSTRHDLEEKMEKCLAGIHNPDLNMKTTTNPTMRLSTTAPKPDCPDGFSKFADHCYTFEMKGLNWSDARQACQDHGAYLVSVNTQDEQDFLVKQIRSYYSTHDTDYYWFGMSLKTGKKVWADGTDVNFTQWAGGEPDCMEIGCKGFISEYLYYQWEDAANSTNQHYICELELTI